MRSSWMLALVGLVGCGGEGTWTVQTWGEDYIEQQIPSTIYADGCSMDYTSFKVSFTERQLLDGDGEVVGEITPAAVFDLTTPGPTPMGTALVPADHYSDVHVLVSPDATSGASVAVMGTLTCGEDAVDVDWAFDETTANHCEPGDLTIPANGEDDTQLTIHGDHLFYDGLENADAVVRGQAIVDADANDDGSVTREELAAVSIPSLGYEVGAYADVLTLDAFVSHLSRTVLHIDGEGECVVDF